MPKGGFEYDSTKLGSNRFIGKVVRFEEMTVAEFDELRSATLSEKVDPDTRVVYLEVENLSSPYSLGRSTFFMPETASVGKWAQFIQANAKLGIHIKATKDPAYIGRVLEWEEGERERGKYGKGKFLEPIGIPSPDELAALAEKPAEKPAPSIGAEAHEPDYTKNLILSCADGLTEAELLTELAGVDIKLTAGELRPLVLQLIGQGRMKKKAGKFEVI